MSDIGVVIPWRPTSDREPLMRWVIEKLQSRQPSWPIRLGLLPDDQPWCKARAVQAGINGLPERVDTIVVHDADVMTDGLDAAVREVQQGRFNWAVPHSRVYRLKENETRSTLDGSLPRIHDLRVLERKPYIGVEGGGITVVSRCTWMVCPLDSRFIGWGQEDEAWGTALRLIYGQPYRCDHPLVHLWHEPQNRLTSAVGSRDGQHLYYQYLAAASVNDGGQAMLQLIRQGRPTSYGEVQIQPLDGSAPNQDVPRLGESCAAQTLRRSSGVA